ncbi:MAG: aldo/keto reductase [Spirochaetales bacterium]|nr:aldo/keto reductase [Spirochaetales bacterium]
MEYKNIGQSGLKVSEYCFGTMTFGKDTESDEASLMVDMAIDAGVNFFDTANSYSAGQSEIDLGNALKGKRSDNIIATKFFNPMGTGPNDSGMSRSHILRAIEDSLRRLQTDYVDIYYIHHVDIQTPLDEMLRAVEDLIRQGKVRYPACSNYEAWRLTEGLWTSDSKNLSRFICYQGLYNLVTRDLDDEVVPLCSEKGLGMVAWGALAGGFLSGKYKPGQRSIDGTRSAGGLVFPRNYFAPNADEILATLNDVSQDVGRSPAAVAINWLIRQKYITSALVGARNRVQLEENLKATNWILDKSLLDRLNTVSMPADRFPYSMEKGCFARRKNAVQMPSLGVESTESDTL